MRVLDHHEGDAVHLDLIPGVVVRVALHGGEGAALIPVGQLERAVGEDVLHALTVPVALGLEEGLVGRVVC